MICLNPMRGSGPEEHADHGYPVPTKTEKGGSGSVMRHEQKGAAVFYFLFKTCIIVCLRCFLFLPYLGFDSFAPLCAFLRNMYDNYHLCGNGRLDIRCEALEFNTFRELL